MNEQQITTLAKNIELVVFDVDGVFTDGRIYIDNQGEETKAFNVRDGHGVRLLIHYGVQVAVISGRNSQAVNYRMKELQVTDILQGHMNKRTAFDELAKQKGLQYSHMAFVGDDIIDVQAMQLAGLSFAVADAHEWVKSHADVVTGRNGGEGAVREVCELILDAKGLLREALNYNLQ